MALYNMKEILADAQARGYGVGFFNTINMEMIHACIAAAEELDSPIIIGTAESLLPIAPFEWIVPAMLDAARRARVPVAVHLDHTYHFNTLMQALRAGFGSIMYDGSRESHEDNLQHSAAMLEAKRLGKIIAAHCEDMALVRGGCIHDGAYARAHHLPGICSESEWRQVERDLRLAEETGCKYHVCHVSTKESVALIRAAKVRGVDVTCETGPHYLTLDENCLQDDGRFKMNPPLRAREDREALLTGLLDGTVDMVATDHAPHSAAEKSRGLRGSLMGVVGLETAFPVLYTHLVKTGAMTLEALLDRMRVRPAARFGFDDQNDWTAFDLDSACTIDPQTFLSRGRATPFAGMRVFGECLLTIVGGKIAWQHRMTAN